MAQEPYRETHVEDPEDLRALGTFLDDIDLVSDYNGQLDITNHVSLEESGSEWTTATANDDLETFSSSDLEGDDWEVDSTEPITKDIFSNPFPSRSHLNNTLPDLEDEDSERVSPPPHLHRQVTPPKNIQARLRLRVFLNESNLFIQEKIQPPISVRPNNRQDSTMEDFYSSEGKTPTSKQVAPRRASHNNAKLRSLLAAKKLAKTPTPKQTRKVKISTKIPPSPLVTPAAPKNQQKLKKRRGPRKKEPGVKTPVEQKTALDVLMGRGGCSNHHAGNEAYRNRILQLQPVYKALARKKKTDFGASVVTWVQDRGGRFLSRDAVGGPWYVVPDGMARQKVSQALREDHSEQGRAAKKAKTTK
jgi:hypothetical protein